MIDVVEVPGQHIGKPGGDFRCFVFPLRPLSFYAFSISLSPGAAVGRALPLGARHIGAGRRNSKRRTIGVLGTGARAVDRNSRRLFLQGASLCLHPAEGFICLWIYTGFTEDTLSGGCFDSLLSRIEYAQTDDGPVRSRLTQEKRENQMHEEAQNKKETRNTPNHAAGISMLALVCAKAWPRESD